MWKVYKYNGHYIQGDLISKHTTESAAMKKAKKLINFTFSEKVKRKNEILIPRSNTNFQKGDTVVFLSKREQIPLVEKMFRISSI